MSGRRGDVSFSSVFTWELIDCTTGKPLSLLVLVDEQLSPVGDGRSLEGQKRPRPLHRTSCSSDRRSANTLNFRERKKLSTK